MAMPNLQRCQVKIFVWSVWIMIFFYKLFICRFCWKDRKTMVKLWKLKNRKTTISSTFLIRLRFQWYRCESGIAIFAWRVAWNYANSPFKSSIFLLMGCNTKSYLVWDVLVQIPYASVSLPSGYPVHYHTKHISGSLLC